MEIENSINKNENCIGDLQSQFKCITEIKNSNLNNMAAINELLISEFKKQSLEIERLGQFINSIYIMLSDLISVESEKQLNEIHTLLCHRNEGINDESAQLDNNFLLKNTEEDTKSKELVSVNNNINASSKSVDVLEMKINNLEFKLNEILEIIKNM